MSFSISRRVLQPPRPILLGVTTYKYRRRRCSYSTSSSTSTAAAATAAADNPNTTAKAAVDVDDLDPAAASTLPKNFGTNQHMYVNDEMKERLRSVLWEFKAPVRYAVAYGSGVFSQGTTKPSGQKPMIDLIFGVTYSQHWHSLNLQQHRDHYSFLGNMGSGVVSMVQDRLGAGMYFNPYVEINGVMVKYGVVNIETLCRDLSDWNSLYIAGRMHKPVKILRNDPRVLLSNHVNLLSAVRVALLLLPETFSEHQLYTTIAGLSYMGDPRMSLPAENPHKVANIVNSQLANFRRLYLPLIQQLPNVHFVKENLSWNDQATHTMLQQDMDPVRRGNMVRRLPTKFRERLYFQYQRKFAIPRLEFRKMIGVSEDDERVSKKQGGVFEQRIAADLANLRGEVGAVITKTVKWPSTVQSLKGILSAGPIKSWKYLGEKIAKWKESKRSS